MKKNGYERSHHLASVLESRGVGRRLGVLVGALLVACLPLQAVTQTGKVHRVAFLATTSPVQQLHWPEARNPAVGGLLRGLAEIGYVEGKNLVFERRSAEGEPSRVRAIVAELVDRKTDVIVVPSTSFAQHVRDASPAIPIVAFAADPVGQGLAQSLGRPGGNVTGLSSDVGAGTQEKRLELLVEMVPNMRRIALLGGKVDWENLLGTTLRQGATKLGLEFFHVEGGAHTFQQAFAELRQRRPDGVVVASNAVFFGLRAQLGQFSSSSGIPVSCPFREQVAAGCLMSYGTDVNEAFRQMAGHVGRILKGTKAGEIPFEQPVKFELAINLKTARAIGVKVPQALLLRADRVIE